MKEELGAPASPSGSRPTGPAPSGLAASRFDPSRIVVFLDFDGVISTPRAKVATGEWIDPIATALLAKLQSQHGFQIAVSSTWRGMRQRCLDALTPSGLVSCLHDDWRTNDDPEGCRSREIEDWLARNGNPEYLILDDDSFGWTGEQYARWVHTECYDGFLFKHYRQMEKMLAELQQSAAA